MQSYPRRLPKINSCYLKIKLWWCKHSYRFCFGTNQRRPDVPSFKLDKRGVLEDFVMER